MPSAIYTHAAEKQFKAFCLVGFPLPCSRIPTPLFHPKLSDFILEGFVYGNIHWLGE